MSEKLAKAAEDKKAEKGEDDDDGDDEIEDDEEVRCLIEIVPCPHSG